MNSSASSSEAEIIARLDRLAAWPYRRSLLWIVGAGYFFGFVDIVNIGYALPVIAKQFHVSASVAASSVTIGLIGYIIGSYVDATISDMYGRRLSLTLSLAVFSLGSLAATFAPNLLWLDIFRFVTGMGIGAEIAAVTTYLGELSPAPLRGRYTGWATTFAYTGFSAVPFIALALVPHFSWGWRALIFVGALGGALIAILRRNIPESPRWLLARGRVQEAEGLVKQAEDRVRQLKGELPLPHPQASEVEASGYPSRALFSRPYFARLVLFMVIWFVYYIANYGWLTLAPTLLVSRGYSLTSTISYLVVSGVGFFVGAVGSALIGDRFERKWLIFSVTVAFGLCLLLIGLFPSPAIIMVMGFLASVSIGLMVPLLYALTAEHFPTRARTTGVSLTDGLGHIGGALAPFFVLTAFDATFKVSFIVMAVASGITAALLPFSIRATKRSLETVAD